MSNRTPDKPFDAEEFRRQAHLVIEFVINYYNNVQNYPVRSQVEPGYLKKRVQGSAPLNPEPIEDILRDVQKDIVPGMTHWQSPNFFGYFPCNMSTTAFLGEMMCTGFNVPGFDWISSPAATELESIVIDWFGKMLQLPEDFDLFSGGGGGVIQGTTCEAVLSTMVAARDKMLKKIGDLLQKLYEKLYCRILNRVLCRSSCAPPSGLRRPLPWTHSASCVAWRIKKEFGIWVHVDAAYAGSACICPEYRHFLNGVEASDSFSFNPHKWFFTGLDCCCLWVKDPTAVIKSLSTNPEYLRNKASESKQVGWWRY